MKILHLIPTLEVGGAERMLCLLVEEQVQLGHDVTVITLQPGGTLAPRIRRSGANLTELKIRGAKRIHDLPSQLWDARRLLRARDVDIVHTWMYHAAVLGEVFAQRGKTVVSIHHEDPIDHGVSRVTRLFARLTGILARRALGVTYVSENAKRRHQQIGYGSFRKDFVIPPGVSSDQFRIPTTAERNSARLRLKLPLDDYTFALLSRFHPDKDPLTLLHAMGLAVKEIPTLRLLLIGRDMTGENPDLARMIATYGLSSAVRLIGEVNAPEDELAAADAICLSSRTESFGLALVEGMLCGLTPIATDVGAVREIVGDTGVVVPASDPYALASALVETARRITSSDGRAARRIQAMRFSTQSVTDAYQDVYSQAN